MNLTALDAPITKGPRTPWSHPLRPPCSLCRDSGTVMSSVGWADWRTARESLTVGCLSMATQQVGVPSLPVVLGWPAMEHKIHPIPFQKKHILVDFKRIYGYADPSGSPTYGLFQLQPHHGLPQPQYPLSHRYLPDIGPLGHRILELPCQTMLV